MWADFHPVFPHLTVYETAFSELAFHKAHLIPITWATQSDNANCIFVYSQELLQPDLVRQDTPLTVEERTKLTRAQILQVQMALGFLVED